MGREPSHVRGHLQLRELWRNEEHGLGQYFPNDRLHDRRGPGFLRDCGPLRRPWDGDGDALRAQSELLRIGWSRHELFRMGSYLLVPLSAGVFPHIFGHWLSARSAHAFRATIILYPIFIAVVWFPSVVLGLVGHIDFPPPIQGPVLVHLILENSGGLLAGLLAAGVFAAIMSSLDSQTLAAGTLFTQDIVRHYGFHDRLSESKQVLFGRLFALISWRRSSCSRW